MTKLKPKVIRNFKGTLNYDYLRLEHQTYLKKLNDALIETALAIQGMQNVLDDVSARLKEGQTTYSIKVPNKLAKLIPIKRNLISLRNTLREDASRNAYMRSIVFLVALIEDYFAVNARRVLCAYPKKLLISAKGKELGDTDHYTIGVRELLGAGSLSAVIEQLAAQRVRDAVYASPQQYLAYFKSVCGVEIKEATWRTYVEIKATRDLFVHADGRVNETYLQKAAQQARAGLGERVIVDAPYFNAATSCLKALISEIYTGLCEKFANSAELKEVFDAGASPSERASRIATGGEDEA